MVFETIKMKADACIGENSGLIPRGSVECRGDEALWFKSAGWSQDLELVSHYSGKGPSFVDT